jgi:hypothetical protein
MLMVMENGMRVAFGPYDEVFSNLGKKPRPNFGAKIIASVQ